MAWQTRMKRQARRLAEPDGKNFWDFLGNTCYKHLPRDSKKVTAGPMEMRVRAKRSAEKPGKLKGRKSGDRQEE
jgi:hypothetical protein